VVKTYTFHRGSFLVELNQRVENNSANDWQGGQYRQFQRTPPKLLANSYFGSGVVTYTGAVISTPEQRYEKFPSIDITKQELNQSVKDGWVAMIQHYFLGCVGSQSWAKPTISIPGRLAAIAMWWECAARCRPCRPARPAIFTPACTWGQSCRMCWKNRP
jgi:hypothetical protein